MVDEDDYGGIQELLKEGLFTAFAVFMVSQANFLLGVFCHIFSTAKRHLEILPQNLIKYFKEKKRLGPNIYVDTTKYVITALRGTITFNEILRSGVNILCKMPQNVQTIFENLAANAARFL